VPVVSCFGIGHRIHLMEAYDGNVMEVITMIWFIHSFSDLWSGLMFDKSLFAYIQIQDNVWMICNLVWFQCRSFIYLTKRLELMVICAGGPGLSITYTLDWILLALVLQVVRWAAYPINVLTRSVQSVYSSTPRGTLTEINVSTSTDCNTPHPIALLLNNLRV